MKVQTVKPDDLSVIPGILTGGENRLLWNVLTSVCGMTHVHVTTTLHQKQTNPKWKNKKINPHLCDNCILYLLPQCHLTVHVSVQWGWFPG